MNVIDKFDILPALVFTGVCLILSVGLGGCGSGGGAPAALPASGVLPASAVSLTDITITPASATVPVGLATNLSAIGTYSDGTRPDISNKVVWTSANNAVASINSVTGVAIGVAAGSTTVNAAMNGITSSPASIAVTAAAMLTGISITPVSAVSPKGETVIFTAKDNTGGNISGTVNWTSSDPKVATLNASGIASTLKKGFSNIIASLNGITSNTARLTVVDPALIAINIAPTSLLLLTGKTSPLVASGVYTDGTTAIISSQVTWASSSAVVASINAAGLVSASAVGTSNITASATGISSKTPAVVSVDKLMGGGLQGLPLKLANSVTLFGGAGAFSWPDSLATDGVNLFLSDQNNHKILKIVIAKGTVSTLAGSGKSTGVVDGAASTATFFFPSGVTTDGTNVYVSDTGNNKIRKIVIATGVVSTLAGNGAPGYGDGAATAALFNAPQGITTDGVNLYVADSLNARIRKIVIASGEVSTLAGSGVKGSTNGVGTVALFKTPKGVTTDGVTLYVTDFEDNTIRKIDIATGIVTTLAGSSGVAGNADAVGAAAMFNGPQGIATDGSSLYVVDSGNNSVRKIGMVKQDVTTLAGTGAAGAVDGIGTAASLANPYGITSDGISLYVTEKGNNDIRKIQ